MDPFNSGEKSPSSEKNEPLEKPKMKRKRSNSTNCHQCHKNDKGRVVRCNQCSKQYCAPCITRWYPTIAEPSFAEACPICRNICNCGACLQSKRELMIPEIELSTEDKVYYLKYKIGVLLPSLKNLCIEEKMETEEKANIQGGSGLQLPESAFSQNDQVEELFLKAQAIIGSGKLTNGQQSSERSCSCLNSKNESNAGIEKLCKAASREESISNYLYYPRAMDADIKHFQWHLSHGDPVIVSNVLDGALGLSWEPMVMERAFRLSAKNEYNVNVINCINWCQEKINVHKFFIGYSKGLFDSQGFPKILKLQNWPLSGSFEKQLPHHFAELVRCLPFKQYTQPATGCLNLASRVPKMCTPDLGPKMCVSYGPYGVDQGSHCYSITKLQYAVSDRVNILMHNATITPTPGQLLLIAKLKKRLSAQEPFKNEGKSPISENRLEHFEDSDCGSIWDIFRREDVPKLEEYLKNHSEEFGHLFPPHQIVHPVHEQKFYLTEEHKWKLKEDYGIEPWTFVQRLGDAIFIPVGCPYQIRNLKSCINVVADFISPENVSRSFQLFSEYSLSQNPEEEKLQMKKLILEAINQAVQDLDNFTRIESAIGGGTLSLSTATGGERPNLSTATGGVTLSLSTAATGRGTLSLSTLRQKTEEMKSILENRGHNLRPATRAMLWDEIQGLLNKLGSS